MALDRVSVEEAFRAEGSWCNRHSLLELCLHCVRKKLNEAAVPGCRISPSRSSLPARIIVQFWHTLEEDSSLEFLNQRRHFGEHPPRRFRPRRLGINSQYPLGARRAHHHPADFAEVDFHAVEVLATNDGPIQ